MPSSFVNLIKKDLFNSGGTADHMIIIPEVDSIMGEEGLAIYDNVTYQLNETIQYFLTFDDVIKFIHFGKGVGTLVANGMMFSNTDGELPGISAFENAITGLRGKEQLVYIGGGRAELTCIMSSSQITVTSDPDTMAHFTFNFGIVQHTL